MRRRHLRGRSPSPIERVDAGQMRRRGLFYGWWVVAGATMGTVLQSGLVFYGFSTFFVPLVNEFGWSRAALSGAFSLARMESGVAAPVFGFLIDRFGPRRIMLFGTALCCLGFILLSGVNSLLMLYLTFAMVSTGSTSAFHYAGSATVAKWFVRRRGLAMGILACGVGVAGFGVAPLTWFIQQYGWRNAAVACGVIFMALAIPTILLMKRRPEQYGLLPDGDTPTLGGEGAPSHESAGAEPARAGGDVSPKLSAAEAETSFRPKQALATKAFWLISLAVTARGVVSAGVAVHEIPALQRIGFAPELAAAALTTMAVLSLPGRLGYGWLADRFDKRYLFALAMIQQALGLVALAFATDFVLVVVFLLLYSPGYGGGGPLQQAIFAEYFGREYFASIVGLSQSIIMWGTAFGPLLAGYVFDQSQSYQIAFIAFAFASVVAMALMTLVRKHGRQLAAPEFANTI